MSIRVPASSRCSARRGYGPQPSATVLADSQNKRRLGLVRRCHVSLTDRLELDLALRYDEDTRENTTVTPTAFLPDPSASNGEIRKNTWSEWQPKATLRFQPNGT